jgi:glycosyltransferase involved in cell wall biosynthesis
MRDLGAGANNLPLVLHTRVVTGSGGGPDKTILNSPRFLPALGYRAICAFLHPPDDSGFEYIRRAAAQRDAPLLSIPDNGLHDVSLIRKLLQICRNHNVAIWHGHDYKSNLLGLIIRQFWPMRLVTTVHGWVTHGSRLELYYAVDRLCLPYYERVICVSDDLRTQCISSGVLDSRCRLIENAIDCAEYRRREDTTAAKYRLGFNGDRLLIGAVGRLSKEKAFDVLIGAFAAVRATGANVQLAIIGEGDERSLLESLISRFQLQDRVSLFGYCANMIDLYDAMDIFVLSSLREGLPNVVLEAMAMEVPVIATRINGVPRIITHGENGLLVSPGVPESIREALLQLIASAEERRRLAVAARRTVERHFSFDVRMRKIAAVYDSLNSPGQAEPSDEQECCIAK